MTKRNGQSAVKQNGGRHRTVAVAKPQRTETAKRSAKSAKAAGAAMPVLPVMPAFAAAQIEDTVEADLSRMISELNEVRMRLDAIVRKLATSALDVDGSRETVDDVERLRMRLLGKLDRVREQLVTRLSEERVAVKDR